MDNISLMDTIEIPTCRFHHKLHPSIFTTTVSVPIVRMTLVLAPVPFAMSYARHGANSGMVAWRRHHKEISIDSIMSDFSRIHLGHPGLGDKMFNNAVDYRALTSISASPPESTGKHYVGNHSSFDFSSIIDNEQRSQEDSLFEKTHCRSSMSSDSLFGEDYHLKNGLLPPNQF